MNYELRNEVDRKLTPIQTIFKNRGMGYSPEEIKHYIDPTEDDLYDVKSIEHIKEGAAMLMSHIQNNDKVLLVVDEDCDGYTSSAFFLNYFYKLFPSFVQNNIKYVVHPNKAHGIPIDLVKEERLVIVPDASSNEYDIHKLLKSRGIDVLVIDHHEAPKFSEYACVLNNQVGDYPNKSLSGVGMVYKFCKYFDSLMNTHYCDGMLDLVALGLVGDMMDLRNFETRYLVKKGFELVTNPFIQAMVIKQSYSIGDQLNPHTAAFYIVPSINAVTRVGSIEEKLIMFESMLTFKAEELIPSNGRGKKGELEPRVTQAIRNCTNLRNKQNRLKEDLVKEIDDIIEKQELLIKDKILVIKVKDPIDAGITGLVANQVANKYQRPTLILNKIEEDGVVMYRGSGRNYANSPIKDLRHLLESTGLFEYAQGHASAFGCSIPNKDIGQFLKVTNELLKDIDFQYKYEVDLEYNNDTISSYDIIDIAGCKDLWGQAIEEPYICIQNVVVNKDNLHLYKEKVLKIDGPDVTYVNLSSNPDEFNSLYSELGCVTINIIGICSINDWDNSAQVLIKDYEIVRKAEYYF